MKHDALRKNVRVALLIIAALFLTSSFYSQNSEAASAAAVARAKKIHKNLNVTRATEESVIIQSMAKLIDEGKVAEAARMASDTRAFYNVHVKEFASIMGSKAELAGFPLNDFQAMVIGTLRDEKDARTLLTGDFNYVPTSGGSYAALEASGTNFQMGLKRVEPQSAAAIPDTAGVLTSQTWAQEHLVAGTNRRAFEYTLREFLCTPLIQARDVSVSDFRVRRDVNRAEGGNPMTYQTDCRGCHGVMDGMAGAFARFDFQNNNIVYVRNGTIPGIAPKMNQHGDVYPEGYTTEDDSWVNLATQNQNEVFGWRGPLKGYGVRSFGQMISNSQMFKSCMVKRTFKQLCRRDLSGAADAKMEQKLADQFEQDNYNLKKLFLNVALEDSCGTSISVAKENEITNHQITNQLNRNHSRNNGINNESNHRKEMNYENTCHRNRARVSSFIR